MQLAIKMITLCCTQDYTTVIKGAEKLVLLTLSADGIGNTIMKQVRNHIPPDDL